MVRIHDGEASVNSRTSCYPAHFIRCALAVFVGFAPFVLGPNVDSNFVLEPAIKPCNPRLEPRRSRNESSPGGLSLSANFRVPDHPNEIPPTLPRTPYLGSLPACRVGANCGEATKSASVLKETALAIQSRASRMSLSRWSSRRIYQAGLGDHAGPNQRL